MSKPRTYTQKPATVDYAISMVEGQHTLLRRYTRDLAEDLAEVEGAMVGGAGPVLVSVSDNIARLESQWGTLADLQTRSVAGQGNQSVEG